MSYREQLARREQILASLPQREYMSNAEFKKLKSALTRAKNSGDPEKVLKAVEHAVERFNDTVWVDDWALWKIALEDAAHQAQRQSWEAFGEDRERLSELADELHAASLVLFR